MCSVFCFGVALPKKDTEWSLHMLWPGTEVQNCVLCIRVQRHSYPPAFPCYLFILLGLNYQSILASDPHLFLLLLFCVDSS